MNEPICLACGTQFSAGPRSSCPICEDERQYVPPTGQGWTTIERMQTTHLAAFRHDGEYLGIGISPGFAIGQRALLVRTPAGNVLWDCISLLSSAMIDLINGLGGLAAIAISHPHYYTTMLEWSKAFGGVPIYLHEADRSWAMRSGPEIVYWTGAAKQILPSLTLIRCPGHFEGGQIMHHAAAAGGRGAVLTGDVLQVTADARHVSFMRSYPNFIPLDAAVVRTVAGILEGWSFDAIYGAFWDRVIAAEGRRSFSLSVQRYLTAIRSSDEQR